MGWEGWETDELASQFLNNPFMNNTCRIAAGYLGTRLAARRPVWSFGAKEAKLSDVGLQAPWLLSNLRPWPLAPGPTPSPSPSPSPALTRAE